MKKYGFTMIEILAVFTITAVILLVTVPMVVNVLKKGNDTAYKEFENNIFLACEAYIVDDNIVVSEGKVSTITIADLVNSGYLKSSIVNPDNNEKVVSEKNLNIVIKINKDEDGVLNFEIERDGD